MFENALGAVGDGGVNRGRIRLWARSEEGGGTKSLDKAKLGRTNLRARSQKQLETGRG